MNFIKIYDLLKTKKFLTIIYNPEGRISFVKIKNDTSVVIDVYSDCIFFYDTAQFYELVIIKKYFQYMSIDFNDTELNFQLSTMLSEEEIAKIKILQEILNVVKIT